MLFANSISLKYTPINGMHKLGKYLNYAHSLNLFFCDFLSQRINIQHPIPATSPLCIRTLLINCSKGYLFIPQGIDGVQTGGLDRRIETRHQPGNKTDAYSGTYPHPGHNKPRF